MQSISSGSPQAPKPKTPTDPPGLLNASELLIAIWPNENSRPSLRWLRGLQAKRVIPHIKVAHLTYFEPARVEAALRRMEIGCR